MNYNLSAYPANMNDRVSFNKRRTTSKGDTFELEKIIKICNVSSNSIYFFPEPMQFFPIKTRLLLPPKDDLFQVFEESISHLQERDIVFISSKVLAIHQGRCVPVGGIDKSELIKQEADHRIVSDVVPDKDIYLTITNQILIPSAGIDESNANGYYILRPRQLDELTREIHTYFTQKFNLQHLGIIITDSTSKILKKGIVGIGMYSYGINPLIDNRGQRDLFGKPLQFSQVNVVDALSAMAVYLMGEANEGTPILIGRDLPKVEFTTQKPYAESVIFPVQDLFRPLLTKLLDSDE